MWNKICSKKDINNLMETFENFHDSCIKEIVYKSGAYVDSNMAMNPINCDRKLRIIFNAQIKNSIAIEMEFLGLHKLNLRPNDEQYSCEISGASVYFENGMIYWVDDSNIHDLKNYHGTWICAKEAKWRTINEYAGKKNIYME